MESKITSIMYLTKGEQVFLEGVRPYLERADSELQILRMYLPTEHSIRRAKNTPIRHIQKTIFNVLKVNEINYNNVVNNHMADYFQIGFDDTWNCLMKTKFIISGTNMKNSDRNRKLWLIKIGFLKKTV